MRDLTAGPAPEVKAERARVATEGWGAQLLALQESDGRWGSAAWNWGWDSTMYVLWLPGEQLPDGGWNCGAPNGATRSSFNTTICCGG